METKIQDMRGRLWSANYLLVHNDKLYYCGYPVHIIKEQDPESIFPSHHHYGVYIKTGLRIGSIALTNEDGEKALLIQSKHQAQM